MFDLFRNHLPIILASASPRRQQFMQELGLAFEILQANEMEPLPHEAENAVDYALRAASAKARCVALQLKNNAERTYGVIIAADTVVCIAGKILGKPKNKVEALQMLKLLAGQRHEVISAVCMIIVRDHEAEEEICFHDSSAVCFHPWAENVLAAYANTDEPLDKAGAYAIQGQGAFLVQSIEGSWSTVVGLPLTKLVHMLLERQIITPIKA